MTVVNHRHTSIEQVTCTFRNTAGYQSLNRRSISITRLHPLTRDQQESPRKVLTGMGLRQATLLFLLVSLGNNGDILLNPDKTEGVRETWHLTHNAGWLAETTVNGSQCN